MLVLVTGATGKVGQEFMRQFLAEPTLSAAKLRVLCHNRPVAETDRIGVVRGSIADRGVAEAAMAGVTHVVHMATVKEAPETAMDVSVKGLFWMLEAFRSSPTSRRFMLISGDCWVGHIFHPYPSPVAEDSPRKAYPGVYALSKVLEETMLEQYFVQYGIDGCCLRAPWIMEKDDFRHVLAFGSDQFGGPLWSDLLPAETIARAEADHAVPLILDRTGAPLKRNFVHASDLVRAMLAALDHPAARQQLFNVAMNRPVDYGAVAEHLQRTRGMQPLVIDSPFHSNWLDNAKARHLLGWEPRYDLHQLIEEAFTYQRAADDPRKIWYAG